MAEAAGHAARRQGSVRAVRVVATDAEGDTWPLVVTADGEVLDAPERPDGSEGRSFRWWWVALPVGVIALVTALAVVTMTVGGGESPARAASTSSASAAPRPTPTQLPVPAPPGWAELASWSAPVGDASGSEPVVAIAGGKVFVATGDAVAAHVTATGTQAWSEETDGPVTAGPAATVVDGRRVVVAATASSVYAWSPASGKQIGKWDLSSGDEVTMTETGPVVTGQDRHGRVIVDGELVSRVIPAEAEIVGPGEAGSLLVAGAPGQVWSVGDDKVAGSPLALEAPKDTKFVRVVAWTGKTVVAAFTATGKKADPSKVVLRSYAKGAWEPQWTSKAVPDRGDEDLMTVATGGAWGTYGPRLVDLRTGEVKGLPEQWRTSTLGRELGFGVVGGRVLSVTPSGLTAASTEEQKAPGEAPEDGEAPAPGAVADGRAFVIAPDGESQHLYALRVDDPAATSTPSPSTSSAPAPKPSSKAPKSTPAPKAKGAGKKDPAAKASKGKKK